MDFVIENNILVGYKGEDENVVIPEGVTEIAKNVFKNCTFIKSVKFPNSLERIGENAFNGCSELGQITFPDSLKELGWYTFCGCTGITEIVFTDNLKSMGWYTFKDCKSLVSVVVAASTTYIPPNIFENCTSLRTVTFLNSPANVKPGIHWELQPTAFKNTKDVLVYAPHISISDSWFKPIRSYAMNGFLKYYYEGRHFDEEVLATNRKFINSQRKKLYSNASELLIRYMTEEKIIPLTDIDDVIEMTKDTEVKAQLVEYKNANFTAKQTEKMKAKKQKDAEKPVNPLSTAELKKEWIFNNLSDSSVEITGYKGSATEVVVPSMLGKKKITRIGNYAFCPCAKRVTNPSARMAITSVVIPDGVTEIGESAFEGCENLENITIPESVCWVECYAFNKTKWFEKLYKETKGDFVTLNNILLLYRGDKSDVEVPEGITAIGGLAFTFDKKQPVRLVVIPPSKRGYPKKLFMDNLPTGGAQFNTYPNQPILTSVKLPQSLKIICDNAFCNCTALMEIEIPNSVVRIGDGAFRNCHALTEITIPEGVTVLDENLFQYCDNLVRVHIPDSVKYVRERAFGRCISLKEVKLADEAVWIGEHAFSHCKSLKQFTIPGGVTTIERGVFSECHNLEEVIIPKGITEIKIFAFGGCESLSDIEIPEGVTEIGQMAFCSGPYYRTMFIPASVTKINDNAFWNQNPDYEYDGYYSGFTVIAPKDSYAAKFAE